MRIGVVCPYRLSMPGGVQEHARYLARELERLGHETTLISPGFGKARYGRKHLFLGRSVKFPTTNKSWSSLSLFFDNPVNPLRQIIHDCHFDLLHFQEPFSPVLSWQLLEISSVPNIGTFHSEWRVTAESLLTESLSFLMQPVFAHFKEKLSGVIAVSKTARQSWPEIFDKTLPERVIPNGVSLGRFNPLQPPVRPFGKNPTVLYVGRLEKRKGLPYLLKAFQLVQKKMPEARLVVVGAGNLRRSAERWAESNALEDKITFAGRVSDGELPSYYTGADVFCSPAVMGESFGVVLLEAMASGVPLVAYDNPGYRELLHDCPVKEILADCGDVDNLADCLLAMLSDADKRKRAREWGLAKVQPYDWPNVAAKVNDFYADVLAQRK